MFLSQLISENWRRTKQVNHKAIPENADPLSDRIDHLENEIEALKQVVKSKKPQNEDILEIEEKLTKPQARVELATSSLPRTRYATKPLRHHIRSALQS